MKWLVYLVLMVLSFSIGYAVPKESMKVVREKEMAELLLPDMIVLPPKQVSMGEADGERVMRFSTTFANIGKGALEIIGHKAVDKEVTYATQYILGVDGPGVYQDVGEFVFHPGHDHWHVQDYVKYELWSLDAEGKVAELKAVTDKMSFCIWDEHTYDLEIENAADRRVYTSPCTRIQQGMSVGWGDTYLARVEGQEIRLGALADGTYLFISRVNPDQKILEGNYLNNSSEVKIEIAGKTLRLLE